MSSDNSNKTKIAKKMEKKYLRPQTETTFLMIAELMQTSSDGPSPAGGDEFPDVGAKDNLDEENFWEE